MKTNNAINPFCHFESRLCGMRNLAFLLLFLICTAPLTAQNLQVNPSVQPANGGTVRAGNFVVDWTLGQPAQTILKSGNLMITQGFEQPEKPQKPIAPSPQTLCSDTPVTFTYAHLAGAGADQLEWSLDSAFSYSNIIYADSLLRIKVSIGTTDTIWLRSRVSGSKLVSAAVYTILKVNLKPEAPTPPAPQSVASDTPVMFSLQKINAGFGANQLTWALDSNFISAHTDTSKCTINITIPPDSIQLLWFKSEDTISGCISDSRTTILIVDTIGIPRLIYDSILPVCSGTATTLYIANTDTSLLYNLKVDIITVSTAFGNGTSLGLNTGNVDTTTIFIIYSTDTSTNSTIALDTIVVMPYAAVDTPEFIIGDTLIFINDTASYFAMAENSVKTIYSLASGGADIDSLGGIVTDITDSLLKIRATSYGLVGCGVTVAELNVMVTDIGLPTTSPEQELIVDSDAVYIMTSDTIFAGTGGDQIQWSFNPDFTGAHILTSPSTLSISLEAGADTIIYLRTRQSASKRVGKAIHKEFRISYPLLSAGLLDKTKWTYNNFGDEFNYSLQLPLYLNSNFKAKWSFNGCPGGWCTNPGNCEWHATWIDNYQRGYYDYGMRSGGLSGSGGEVFNTADPNDPNNRILHIEANKISSWKDDCTVDGVLRTDRDFSYKTGKIMSTNNVGQGLFEIRCKAPNSGSGSWHAFWLTNNLTEYDIAENDIGTDEDAKRSTSAIWNWSETDPVKKDPCGHKFIKSTACNFSEDWHTYSLLWSSGKIIFFTDGKETWSTLRSTYPADITSAQYVIINLAITQSAWPTPKFEYLVDYFRYYTPATGNNITIPQCIQNMQGGIVKTLETPSQLGSQSQVNNKSTFVVGLPSYQTSTVTANTRIRVINSGNSVKPFFRISARNGTNGVCTYLENFNGLDMWRQKTISATSSLSDGFPITSVKDWITPLNESLIYFQNQHNALKYYKKTNVNLITHTFSWEEGTPFKDNIPNQTLPTCGGSVSTDNLSRVWFRGVNTNPNTMYCWDPRSNGYLGSAILPYSDGSDAVAVHSCGCIIFYRSISGDLKQKSWGVNGNPIWQDVPIPTFPVKIISDQSKNIILDETHSRVFYIGTDHSVYCYNWDFNQSSSIPLQKLGYETCQNNVLSDLTLSNNGDCVYYKGTDGLIWYYFNDHDSYLGKVNWNKTCMNAYRLSNGPMAFEASSFGKLFYVGIDSKLWQVDWVNGENNVDCPQSTMTNVFYKTNESKLDTVTAQESPIREKNNDDLKVNLIVSPNPSLNNFKFTISGLFERITATLKVINTDGKIIYVSFIKDNESRQLIWDASGVSSGIYYYQVNINSETKFSGKLLKM